MVSPTFASTSTPTRLLNAVSVHSIPTLLDPNFNPLKGGVPFCFSGSRGTITCYPPSFLKTAYDFPSTNGENGLDGSGQTVVIVDAFGSPTIQADLNTFDKTFGLPAATVTRLCGPTWTGASTDKCPVNTIADLSTATNAAACGAIGWAEETTLDVTMVHGLAPGAKIVLVASNDCQDVNINAAEMAVVTQESLRGSVMSQSFGEPDDVVGCVQFDANNHCVDTDPSIKATADKIYTIAAENQWTVVASSGDDGANTNARVLGTRELTPSWPSSNPLNLATGGTQGSPYGGQYGAPPGAGKSFSCAAHTTCNTGLVIISGGTKGCTTAIRPGEPSGCTPLGYGGEATWNEFTTFGLGTSTGGGVSSLYERPSYQDNLPNHFSTLFGNSVEAEGRLTPDVSFNSAIMGGVLAPLSFLAPPAVVWAVFGGTSAASPAWAAIIALLNQANNGPVGFLNPAIYALGQTNHHEDSSSASSAFHDITKGENSDSSGQPWTFPPIFGPVVQPPLDGFNAGTGWDMTTGWGTPDVTNFIHSILQFTGEGSGNN
ncbi:MAG: S53 family peptidase [Thaumarchaeota archaeon]|nr:S53 family peptidase [Nitrososphaerota archaeon]